MIERDKEITDSEKDSVVKHLLPFVVVCKRFFMLKVSSLMFGC
ncbi:MAG TPA: hypothetical protein VFY09_00200 [Flavobacteriaceae bacterium]|nr:hypothetical protein [Flavobacteriaceae bacterium]